MTVTVDQVPVHYEEYGAGETLLFLHGWGAPVSAYRPVLALLSQRFRVIAPDMPGVGGTPEPPQPMTLDDYVAFILGFCRALGIDSAVIACHSHGGRIAARLLANPACPIRCPRAVFIDAAGIPPRRSTGWKIRQSLYKLLRILGTSRLTAPLFAERYEVTRDRRSSADYRAASPVMRRTLTNVVGCDLRQELSRITADVLLIWGDRDTATPPSDGQEMERLLSKAGLVLIQNAGHFPFVDNPVQFNAVLKAYLGIN